MIGFAHVCVRAYACIHKRERKIESEYVCVRVRGSEGTEAYRKRALEKNEGGGTLRSGDGYVVVALEKVVVMAALIVLFARAPAIWSPKFQTITIGRLSAAFLAISRQRSGFNISS